MAAFGTGGISLRDTGQPAELTAMVGSAFAVPLIFKRPDGAGVLMPVNLTGWTLDAKGELRQSEWTAEDRLVALHDIIDGTSVISVTITPDSNQSANPGLFFVDIEADVLPAANRDIAIDETNLPTLATWIRFSNSTLGVVEQARLATGFRRGYGSLA